MEFWLRACGKLPEPEREYRFHPVRRWRLDFAWPSRRLAVEVDGMVHRAKCRFQPDRDKRNQLTLMGWAVITITGLMLRNDPEGAVRLIEEAYNCRSEEGA